ncbi:prepilin-type N-terminal cleavage/methylation domain-containing protein [Marmoricola sp. OAE513]|uniref:type II secretion system protein n=1 Tax=Marmoricola sp. OAE513 TaxID=2817894 RepID=UPI001AE9994A
MLSSAVNRARAARREESGFTLIELLIVIVILGVLSGIVVFSVRGITDNSKESACKAEVKTVAVAIEAYRADKGTYPTTVTILGTTGFLRSSDTKYVNDALGANGTMTLSSTPGTCTAG